MIYVIKIAIVFIFIFCYYTERDLQIISFHFFVGMSKGFKVPLKYLYTYFLLLI